MSILSAPAAWRRSSPTRWYVVFCEAKRRHWWDRLFRTPAGFSHVYALRWDGFNWLVFNPAAEYSDIAIAAVAHHNALDLLIGPDATVVDVQAFRRVDRIRGRWWIGPMTCVEQVKALLGLPVGFVFTPWQLYRYLTEECDGQQTGHAGADGGPARGRAAVATVCRRPDPRGEPAT